MAKATYQWAYTMHVLWGLHYLTQDAIYNTAKIYIDQKNKKKKKKSKDKDKDGAETEGMANHNQ